jgi:hypothetical protein
MFDHQEILPTVLQVLSDLVAVDSSGDLVPAQAAKVQCKHWKKDGSDNEDLQNAFGALGVKASLEKNRSAAVILEQYNRSLETASNIKSNAGIRHSFGSA